MKTLNEDYLLTPIRLMDITRARAKIIKIEVKYSFYH